MKIDAKAVTYFESCNSPVDKEGYLYKKGEIKTSYRKRWFVLKGNLLFYKDCATDHDLIGVIVLEGCTVQLCESDEQFAFSLVWSEQGLRTYKFAAEDQASLESWIKALLSANHNYLALLVMDMEKKYRDVLGMSSNEPGKSFTMPNFKTPGEMDYPAARLSPQTSASTFYVAPDFVPGPSGSSSQMLQALALSSRSTGRSPKLWPKRNANAAAANAFAPALGEGLGGFSVTKEEFIKLHEDFGKEVKKLIADWSKRGQGGNTVQEENLIDFS